MVAISKKSIRWSLIFLTAVILIGVLAVSAQGTTATPISIGQNVSGQLTDPAGTVLYSISVAAPQSVNIQVLAISSGFAPTFRVLDPANVVVLDTANPGTLTIAQASPNLSSPGTYTIEVKSANNAPGQFLISVQPGAPLAPPTPLTPGQPVSGSVNAQTTRQAYSFAASPSDMLLLNVISTNPAAGPVVTLRDGDSGDTLGMSTARLAGVNYLIPSGAGNYLVEVTSSGGSDIDAFTVCLATESGSATCPGAQSSGPQPTAIPPDVAASPTIGLPTPSFPSPTPTLFFVPTATSLIVPTVGFAPAFIDPNGSCQVATSQNQFVNIRSGPGTNFNVLVQLPPTATALVIGRLADNSWLQVNYNGTLGWISATVVVIGGNCTGVTVVAPPTAIPSPTMTSSDTDTPTPTPTDTDTPMPTNTPGGPTNTPRFRIQGTLHFQLISTPTPTLFFQIHITPPVLPHP